MGLQIGIVGLPNAGKSIQRLDPRRGAGCQLSVHYH